MVKYRHHTLVSTQLQNLVLLCIQWLLLLLTIKCRCRCVFCTKQYSTFCFSCFLFVFSLRPHKKKSKKKMFKLYVYKCIYFDNFWPQFNWLNVHRSYRGVFFILCLQNIIFKVRVNGSNKKTAALIFIIILFVSFSVQFYLFIQVKNGT